MTPKKNQNRRRQTKSKIPKKCKKLRGGRHGAVPLPPFFFAFLFFWVFVFSGLCFWFFLGGVIFVLFFVFNWWHTLSLWAPPHGGYPGIYIDEFFFGTEHIGGGCLLCERRTSSRSIRAEREKPTVPGPGLREYNWKNKNINRLLVGTNIYRTDQ